MIEARDAIIETLQAATGVGEDLEGVSILKNLHQGATAECVVVSPLQQIVEGWQGEIKYCTEQFRVMAMVEISKKQDGDDRQDDHDRAETIARTCDALLRSNKALVYSGAAGGLSRQPDANRMVDKIFTETVEEAAEFAVCRMTFEYRIIYRGASVALE